MKFEIHVVANLKLTHTT